MRKMNCPSAFRWLISFTLLVSLCAGPLLNASAQANAGSRARTESRTSHSFLSQYASDLTQLARQGKLQPVSGYDAQVERTLQVLSRDVRNSPVLLSEAGAIRSLIVEALSQRIAAGDVPARLRDKQLFRLNLDALYAGSRNDGEIEARLDGVLSDAKNSGGHVILFIDALDEFVRVNAGRNTTVKDILEAALARNELQLIGASTEESFKGFTAQSEVLERRVQGIRVEGETAALVDSTKEDAAETVEAGEQHQEAFVGEKVSGDLRDVLLNASGTERVSVILQGDDLKNAELRGFLKRNGVHVTGDFNRLSAQAIEVPLNVVEKLSGHEQVSYLSLDQKMSSLDDRHLSMTSGAENVREYKKPNPDGTVTTIKFNGAGVGIAILDSGIYAAHQAFLNRSRTKSRVVFSKDFTGEGRTDDPYGHGTHVASLAAGNGQIANGAYTGVAPDANIINLRVLNSSGAGTTSSVLNAINWILTNRTTYNIRVVNMSLGAVAVNSYKNDPICRAVRSLANVGIVVAAAAGNEGKDSSGRKVYGQIHSPGNEPSAITVGAANTYGTNTRADDGVATYSSRGPTRSYWKDSLGVKHYDNLIKPDLVAPGNKLVGAESVSNFLVRMNPTLDDNVSPYSDAEMMTLSGTSMATPVVAGTAALLLQANPRLTPNMIKALLMYTAQPLRGYNSFEQGAGQVNVSGAVILSQLVRSDLSASTPLGTPLFTQVPPAGTTIGATTIAGSVFTWSQGIILNHTYATGYALGLYQNIYAQGTLLGDCELTGSGVLSGDMTMITQGVMLGDNILTSSGTTLSQGTPFVSTGVLIGDGVMIGDGTMLGDGVLIGDGTLIGDGVMIGDNINSSASSALVHGDSTAAMSIVRDSGIINLNY